MKETVVRWYDLLEIEARTCGFLAAVVLTPFVVGVALGWVLWA